MVESDGGNGILIVGAVSDGLDECGLACVLQSDDGDFQFLAEELALDPIQNFINKSHHLQFI